VTSGSVITLSAVDRLSAPASEAGSSVEKALAGGEGPLPSVTGSKDDGEGSVKPVEDHGSDREEMGVDGGEGEMSEEAEDWGEVDSWGDEDFDTFLDLDSDASEPGAQDEKSQEEDGEEETEFFAAEPSDAESESVQG
jgi:hypothetical protein